MVHGVGGGGGGGDGGGLCWLTGPPERSRLGNQ